MLGGWPGQYVTNVSIPKRAAAHVNPLPAGKPSKRAKYGDVAEANKARRLARSPKPPVIRPRPKRAHQYFQELIQSAEQNRYHSTQQHHRQQTDQRTKVEDDQDQDQDSPQAQQQQRQQPTHGQKLVEDCFANDVNHLLAPESNPDPDPVANSRMDRNKQSSALASGPVMGTSFPTSTSTSVRFQRRRKLFEDSPDGPHPRMTAKIVARLAACKHWRRPLAHRLLPRYLPLFDQHAAAYFFRHVPSLQPRNPQSPPGPGKGMFRLGDESGSAYGSGPLNQGIGRILGGDNAAASNVGGAGGGGTSSDRDVAGFRRMVVAVCCSLLPKISSFGPRALSCMIYGLGRMGISHGPTLAAWQDCSITQLGLMRPDQLVASLEGLAALQGPAATSKTLSEPPSEGNLRRRTLERKRSSSPPPLGEAWCEAALAAARCALPRMTVAEVSRMLMAVSSLGLSPPSELLNAACDRVRDAVVAEAARLVEDARCIDRDANLSGGVSDARNSGSSNGAEVRGHMAITVLQTHQTAPPLLAIATAVHESAAKLAAAPYQDGLVSAAGGAVGVLAAAAAAGSSAKSVTRRAVDSKQKRTGAAGARRRLVSNSPQPELVRGREVATFVRGLGRLGCVPSREWMSWLEWNVEAVIRVDLQRTRTQQQRSRTPPPPRAASRRLVAAAAAAAASHDVAAGPAALLSTDEAVFLSLGDAGARSADVDASLPMALPLSPFFRAEDLAEMAAGLSELMMMAVASRSSAEAGGAVAPEGAEEAAGPTVPSSSPPPLGAAGELSAAPAVMGSASSPPPPTRLPAPLRPPPTKTKRKTTKTTPLTTPTTPSTTQTQPELPVSSGWLDLLLEAALEDIRRRLDAESAVAAAAAAAASAPTAVLSLGDVTKAEQTAVAGMATTATAAAAAAAAAVPAASCLLAALLDMSSGGLRYTPPRHWCMAAVGLGLELVPYMPPSALLLWLRSIAAWGAPKPLPPAWHAAAAVTTRTQQLRSCTVEQLCELPRVMAAAGVRLSAAWGLQYVCHLASRLPEPTGRRALPGKGLSATPGSGRLPRRRHRRWRQRESLLANQFTFQRRVSRNLDNEYSAMISRGEVRFRLRGRKGDSRAVTGTVSLTDAAEALGWLPYVVPDVRCVAEYESAALEALARAFGVFKTQEQPELPHVRGDSTPPLRVDPRALKNGTAKVLYDIALTAPKATSPTPRANAPGVANLGGRGATGGGGMWRRDAHLSEASWESVTTFFAAVGWLEPK